MDRDRLQGSMLDGRYVFGEIVEEREVTNVYLAEDLRTGATLSIEVLRDGLGASSLAARALRRRAMTACRVSHPNVIMPRDVGSLPDQTSFIVEKRLEGRTLEERVRAEGPMAAQDVVRIGVQILSAIAAAHEACVAHGALGPDSVFLAAREGIVLSALVSGFGSERAIDAETRCGYLALAFRPPECTGKEPPAFANDVYAVAAVLHLAATGYPPYSAPSTRSLGEAIAQGSSRTPLLAARLARVLVKALSPEPARRFTTADEMLRALLRAREPARTPSTRPRRESQTDVDEVVPTVRGDALLEDTGVRTRRPAEIAASEELRSA